MSTSRRLLLLIVALAAPLAIARGQTPERPTLSPDDRVLVVGDTLAERVAQSGYLAAALHAAFPDHRLVIRHAPGSADTFNFQPREMNVPTTDDIIASFDPRLIIAMYGMTDAFAATDHRADVEAYLDRVATLAGADGAPPAVMLVSPLRHEFIEGRGPDRQGVAAHNEEIAAVCQAMREAASARPGVTFVDLFNMSLRSPLTTNGIHPDEAGCARIVLELLEQNGWMPAEGAAAPERSYDDAVSLRRMACDIHFLYRLVYRPTNTEYVFGRRHEPFGIVNFPVETAQLQRMLDARDRAIHALPKPEVRALLGPFARTDVPLWDTTPSALVLPEDAWTAPEVESKGTETSLGSTTIAAPEAFLPTFTVAPGYEISCWASEVDFPDLANPLAMTFDERGRLWVISAITYPHLLPGAQPACRIIVLSDTDGDGRADERAVFADHLMIPTGLAVDLDGVYVGQAPDLFFLQDTDGDGRADRREIVASGFGMPDSHHTISAFEWDPAGGILMHEGVFTKSNVESPWGPLRTVDAAVWRFDPRTRRLTVMSHSGFANPWGHVFDNFGQSIMADASGGSNHDFSHVIAPYTYPHKPERPDAFLNRGRPTAGCELILSRHFPEDVQGTYVVNQSIGFHGTRWSRITPGGSTWRGEPMPHDLLSSSDTNFRPVAMEIGPDGALYIADWCNPIIGHMQYSVRDPRRDHTHGRIWRLRHTDRPLVQPPDIADAAPATLFDLLRLDEPNTRRHARRRLQRLPWTEVEPAMLLWLGGIAPVDPLHDRLLLEALWLHQAHGAVRPGFVERVLEAEDERARAAAVRVVRHWLQEGEIGSDAALPLLERAGADDAMRVRLEAMVAAGFLPAYEGSGLVSLIADLPMDDPMRVVMEAVLADLARRGDIDSDLIRRFRLDRLPVDELMAAALDEIVATARLTRADVPLPARREALAALASLLHAPPLDVLARIASDTTRPDRLAPIGELLLDMPVEQLEDVDAWEWGDAFQPWYLATLARVRPDLPWNELSGGEVMAMLEVLPPGAAPPGAIQVLRALIEQRDPALMGRAVDQYVRHETHAADAFEVLLPIAAPARERSLARWNEELPWAMAAIRGMHRLPQETWPGEAAPYRMEMLTPAEREQADALYHDEAFGCARCHGDRGQGAEGFPPLVHSRRLLGAPRRVAGIVVHGLYGRVEGADGRVVESAMAPLGGLLTDEQIALLTSYARQSWGNFAGRVTVEDVAAAREMSPPDALWHVDRLDAAYPLSHDLLTGPMAPEAWTTSRWSTIPTIWLAFGAMLAPVVIVVVAVVIESRRRAGGDSG